MKQLAGTGSKTCRVCLTSHQHGVVQPEAGVLYLCEGSSRGDNQPHPVPPTVHCLHVHVTTVAVQHQGGIPQYVLHLQVLFLTLVRVRHKRGFYGQVDSEHRGHLYVPGPADWGGCCAEL